MPIALVGLLVALLGGSFGEGENPAAHLRPDRAAALLERGFGVDSRGALEMLGSLVPDEGDTAAVKALVEALNSESFPEREAAERKIAGYGERARRVLEAAIGQSGDPEIKLRLQRLIRTVGDSDTDIAVAAALRLLKVERPPAALPALLASLPHIRGSWNRSNAGQLLVGWATPDDFPALLVFANDPDLPVSVRVVVVPALGNAHGDDPEKLAAIESFFGGDQAARLRLAAARVFAEQGRRGALKPLVDLLSVPDRTVSRGARQLLSLWVDGDSAPPLDDPVAARRWFLQHGATAVLLHPLPTGDGGPIVGYLTAESGEGVMRFGLDGKATPEWGGQLLLPCSPYDAEALPGGRVMVCERGEGAVRIFDEEGKVERTIAEVGSPTDAELLDNGNVIVLDNSAGEVHEVDPDGETVWRIGGLENAYDVDRLPDGNTIVADSGNGRLVEFDPDGKVVWEAKGLDFPNNVHRLADGSTLYTTYTSGDLILIDPEGRRRFARNFEGATLYSIAMDGDRIYVSDGSNGCIYALELDGKLVSMTHLPAGFSDVGFVRE